MVQKIALISAVILPLWNIPLIFRIVKRKSSADISLYWAIGVWSCLGLMSPAGLVSDDLVFKVFTIFNFLIFSIVIIFVFIYRKKK